MQKGNEQLLYLKEKAEIFDLVRKDKLAFLESLLLYIVLAYCICVVQYYPRFQAFARALERMPSG